MLKKILIFLILTTIVKGIFSQKLELKELSSPSTPAFTLLGLSPTNISRPNIAKSFIMSLANGLNGKSIASDIAIETTPFWWASHPGLTYKEYYGLDKRNDLDNVFHQIARTFSVSMATSDASPDIDSIDSRNLAAGFRFQVLNGKPPQGFIETYNTLRQDIILKHTALRNLIDVKLDDINSYEELKSGINASVEEVMNTNDDFKNVPNQQKNVLKKMAVEYILNFSKDLDKQKYNRDSTLTILNNIEEKLSDQVIKTLVEMQGMSRIGWLLEFSWAASWLSPTNSIDNLEGQEWAGWGTLTYRFDSDEGSQKTNDFNFMVRLGGNFRNIQSYNRDVGISWVIVGNDHSFSLESIFRSYFTYKNITATDGRIYKVSESDNTWRFACSYQYKISDYISISLTAGKDFKNSAITAGGIFSLMNFNLTIPSKQLIEVNL